MDHTRVTEQRSLRILGINAHSQEYERSQSFPSTKSLLMDIFHTPVHFNPCNSIWIGQISLSVLYIRNLKGFDFVLSLSNFDCENPHLFLLMDPKVDRAALHAAQSVMDPKSISLKFFRLMHKQLKSGTIDP
jgi:hypothetical protein